ncbi:MAG TPA: SRPBCC family protein [Candidatus Limnocylindrales bacterium]|nr:SRPBCC family protein [Candidatus Limnocylindrales bacterium]
MDTTRITAEPGLPYVDMEREFDAPPELLLRAYTEPELLVQWLGPRRLTMRVEQLEARHGGAYRYVHTDTDGTEYGFHGVFHGTPSVEGITQTFEYEGTPGHVSLDSLTFEEREGRTLVRSHSVFQSVEDRDAMVEAGMERGVREGNERLDELLARLTAPVA